MTERRLPSFRVLAPALVLLLVLTACSSGEKEVKPAEYLLQNAEQAWAKKKWQKAAEFYGQVRDYYPYHTEATLAQFRAAEALYREEKYPESLAAFETFDELHPTHEQQAHVLLRIGQCHFRMSLGIDRDQEETHNAIQVLGRVVKRYPDLKEGQEAKSLIHRAYLKLVRHELYVARFYRRAKSYQAAVGRLEKAMAYPDVGYGKVLAAEMEISKALAEGKKKPRVTVPPEPKQDKLKWWQLWD